MAEEAGSSLTAFIRLSFHRRQGFYPYNSVTSQKPRLPVGTVILEVGPSTRESGAVNIPSLALLSLGGVILQRGTNQPSQGSQPTVHKVPA